MIRYRVTKTTDDYPALWLEMSRDDALALAMRLLDAVRCTSSRDPSRACDDPCSLLVMADRFRKGQK